MKRKKIMLPALLLAIALAAGCAPAANSARTGVPVRVAALMGPTGMGMAPMMERAEKGELTDELSFLITGAPDDIVAKIVSGEVDIAAAPINLASTLYQRTEGDVVMLAVNTLGVLYVLEAGEEIQAIGDLAGRTLYATGQASTPEYMLSHILTQNGLSGAVTVEYLAEHSELAALAAAGEVNLAMLPEPNVTATLMKNPDLRVALDLTEEWNRISETEPVQGCIIARRAFVEENPEAIADFLARYGESTAYVNESPKEAAALIEKHGVMASAAAAEKAIPNCNIVCLTGEEMRTAASAMLQVLFEANPKSVGGAMPGDDLYHMGS